MGLDLASFVIALARLKAGAHLRPPHGRGGPLAERDEQVRRSIAALGERIDGDASLRSWEESLHASAWGGEEVWHGDSLPGNLLVVDGRLSAVIDFGFPRAGASLCGGLRLIESILRRPGRDAPPAPMRIPTRWAGCGAWSRDRG